MYALFLCYFDPDGHDETALLAVASSREKLATYADAIFAGGGIVFVDSPFGADEYEKVKRLWITSLVEADGVYTHLGSWAHPAYQATERTHIIYSRTSTPLSWTDTRPCLQ